MIGQHSLNVKLFIKQKKWILVYFEAKYLYDINWK